MKGGSKRNFTSEKTALKNFFHVTHLCQRPPSKIPVTMVGGRSDCLARPWCKACPLHGINPIFRGLARRAGRNEIAWISKRNKMKFFTKEVDSKRNETKTKQFFIETKRNLKIFLFQYQFTNYHPYKQLKKNRGYSSSKNVNLSLAALSSALSISRWRFFSYKCILVLLERWSHCNFVTAYTESYCT